MMNTSPGIRTNLCNFWLKYRQKVLFIVLLIVFLSPLILFLLPPTDQIIIIKIIIYICTSVSAIFSCIVIRYTIYSKRITAYLIVPQYNNNKGVIIFLRNRTLRPFFIRSVYWVLNKQFAFEIKKWDVPKCIQERGSLKVQTNFDILFFVQNNYKTDWPKSYIHLDAIDEKIKVHLKPSLPSPLEPCTPTINFSFYRKIPIIKDTFNNQPILSHYKYALLYWPLNTFDKKVTFISESGTLINPIIICESNTTIETMIKEIDKEIVIDSNKVKLFLEHIFKSFSIDFELYRIENGKVVEPFV